MGELYSAVEVGDRARVEAIHASSEEAAVDPEEMSDAIFGLAHYSSSYALIIGQECLVHRGKSRL